MKQDLKRRVQIPASEFPNQPTLNERDPLIEMLGSSFELAEIGNQKKPETFNPIEEELMAVRSDPIAVVEKLEILKLDSNKIESRTAEATVLVANQLDKENPDEEEEVDEWNDDEDYEEDDDEEELEADDDDEDEVVLR